MVVKDRTVHQINELNKTLLKELSFEDNFEEEMCRFINQLGDITVGSFVYVDEVADKFRDVEDVKSFLEFKEEVTEDTLCFYAIEQSCEMYFIKGDDFLNFCGIVLESNLCEEEVVRFNKFAMNLLFNEE